jgi:hypothetical protein
LVVVISGDPIERTLLMVQSPDELADTGNSLHLLLQLEPNSSSRALMGCGCLLQTVISATLTDRHKCICRVISSLLHTQCFLLAKCSHHAMSKG